MSQTWAQDRSKADLFTDFAGSGHPFGMEVIGLA